MDIKQRLVSLLSRKFLMPIVAVILFTIWKAWLNVIPIEAYALVVGSLCGAYLGFEGIKDIIVAIGNIKISK